MKKGIIVGVAVAAVICAAVLPRFMGNQQFAEAVALPVMEHIPGSVISVSPPAS